jgi:uncharacterized protein YdeI (YjbR/CyaY-like superfamily)
MVHGSPPRESRYAPRLEKNPEESSVGKKDARFDAYIQKAAPFAQPILTRLRGLVHAACPDVVETLKWGHPSFDYKGILAGMAAFKQHVAFGFWKHDLVVGAGTRSNEAMGSFGRITRLAELPPAARMSGWIRKAMELNDAGVKVERVKTRRKKPIAMHPDFAKALARDKRARTKFDAFSPSHQREYMEWIGDAKQDATRERRIATTLEWLAQGKSRNWKYERR